MGFNDEVAVFLPIILEGVKWIKEKMKPTKQDLKLKISELEEEIKILSYGNQLLINNMELIILKIIDMLKLEKYNIINSGAIIQINYAQSKNITTDMINNKLLKGSGRKLKYPIFDNAEEEIIKYKLKRPSERTD